jgi:hypothetical protein
MRIVYWRISLIISIVTCLAIWGYNKLSNNEFKPELYFFILLVCVFLNYWMHNFFNYHYAYHICLNLKESVNQLRNKI